MRFAATVLTICAAFLVSTAQNGKPLPGELQPDPTSIEKARELGAGVFKLLPRGMFSEPFNSYSDADNAIGIRGGGAYYSFSTRDHSYNSVPEVQLENGNLSAGGFAGLNYGIMADLGSIGLDDLASTPEREALLGYVPPVREVDIRTEQGRRHRLKLGDREFYAYLPAAEGHTYLIRAISYGKADKLVAFHILKMDEGGSLTILWITIKDFGAPKFLTKADEELSGRVNEVLSKMNASEVQFSVESGIVKLNGSYEAARYSLLIRKVAELNPRGIENNVIRK
jgi:hypothetical protein